MDRKNYRPADRLDCSESATADITLSSRSKRGQGVERQGRSGPRIIGFFDAERKRSSSGARRIEHQADEQQGTRLRVSAQFGRCRRTAANKSSIANGCVSTSSAPASLAAAMKA